MAYEEMSRVTAKPHCISIEGRAKLSVTGVEDVSGFDENVVVMLTSLGELTVKGENLHIDKIDLDSGELEVRGQLRELSYEEQGSGGSVWSKLFG